MTKRRSGFFRNLFTLGAVLIATGLHYRTHTTDTTSTSSTSSSDPDGNSRPHSTYAGSNDPVATQQEDLTEGATSPAARPTDHTNSSPPEGKPTREELEEQNPGRTYREDLPYGWYEDGNNRVHDDNGWFAPDPSVTDRGHNRDTEYPGNFSADTHDRMAADWTDEGLLLSDGLPASVTRGDPPTSVPLRMTDEGVIVDPSGKRVPRDELTWRDNSNANNGLGNVIPYYDSEGNTNLTYDHDRPVVKHWIDEGHAQSYEDRHEWYNDANNLVPMNRAENSSSGSKLPWKYSDAAPDPGSGYTSRYD